MKFNKRDAIAKPSSESGYDPAIDYGFGVLTPSTPKKETPNVDVESSVEPTTVYVIKLWDNEKMLISKEDYDQLNQGLFIQDFKFRTISGAGNCTIPLANIKLWYSVEPHNFKDRHLK